MTEPKPHRAIEHWFGVLGIPADYGHRHRLKPLAEPAELVPIGQDLFGRDQSMEPQAAEAWRHMEASAKEAGVVLQVVSAYRSIDYQAAIIQKKLDRGQAIDEILTVSAAPGFSEHHTGQALDLTTPDSPPLEDSFSATQAYAWLRAHASEFGFVESFGKNNPHGLIWEPWHWCYRAFLIAA